MEKILLNFDGVGNYEVTITEESYIFRVKSEKFKNMPKELKEFQNLLWNIFTSPNPEMRVYCHKGPETRSYFIGKKVRELKLLFKAIKIGEKIPEIERPFYEGYYSIGLRFTRGCCLLKDLIRVNIESEVLPYGKVDRTEPVKEWIKEKGWENYYVDSMIGDTLVSMIREDVREKEFKKFILNKDGKVVPVE